MRDLSRKSFYNISRIKMKNIVSVVTLLLFVSFAAYSRAQSQNDAFQSEVQIGIDEHLGDFLPEGIELVDIEGNKVQLSSMLDKATILSFVYYRCPGICTPLMDAIAEVVNLSDLTLGKDFQVLTISFDPSEGPELAMKKRNNYSMLVKKEGMENGWRFYTADSLNVARLTNAVGFKYRRTGNDFIHSASLIFVSPNGKITRYLNGTYFLPFELKLAVVETSQGMVGGTVNKVLKFCYSYDPSGKSYVMNVTKIAGTLMIFMALMVLAILMIKPKRKEKTNQ
jgi:protein SCO1